MIIPGPRQSHPPRHWIWWSAIVMLMTSAWLPRAFAQRGQSKTIPGPRYYAAFRDYYRGDYTDALREFRGAARGGVFSSLGRWVDAICYHTMAGECYYHMGDLTQALEQYDSSVRIYLAQKDWMHRVQFPAWIEPAQVRRTAIQWGRSERQATIGRIPKTMLSFQGRLDNENVIKQGGIVAAPELVSLHVTEVLRCLTLSIRRRTELMGPACRHDPLTGQLVQSLSTRPAPPNHWSQGWIDALLGLAYLGADRHDQGVERLQRAIVLADKFDHPLTPTMLLELGKVALARDQFEAASTFLLEATYIGAYYDQADVVSEAFHYASVAHLISKQPGVYTPLIPAARWARTNHFDALRGSLMLCVCEQLAYHQEVAQAEAVLRDAGGILGRRDMRNGSLGAQLQYQTALVQFERGRGTAGETALQAALAWGHGSSRWLFQMALVEQLFVNGKITPRIAGTLFEEVLREPTSQDWVSEPFETLSVITSPSDSAWTHWFSIAYENKQFEKALEIADQIRRRRFYASLPLGGRLLALRWLLAGPDELLTENAQLQRQDFLVQYPDYAELSQQADTLRQAIAGKSFDEADPGAVRALTGQFQTLADLSDAQEQMLLRLSVRREPSEFSFPPRRTVAAIREQLRDDQRVVVFFAAQRQMFAFSLSKAKYSQWQVESPEKIPKLTATLLREWGNFEKNGQLKLELLQSDDWKKLSAQLMQQMFPEDEPSDWDKVNELVIVPDGTLWYLPFEALQFQQEGQYRSLISSVRIRYVPTMSLVHPRGLSIGPVQHVALVPGKVFSRDDQESATTAIEQLTAMEHQTFLLQPPLLVPTRFTAPFWDRLIVLRDVNDTKNLLYDWSPTQLDSGKPGNRLADWVQLPWGAPAQMLLPGFHTPAEDGLKRRSAGDTSDLFLTTCGLMAAGSRTVLLSRWRTGGQTAYDLIVEFARELPFSDAASAWQRSVQLARESELDPALEPRIRWRQGVDVAVTAQHPFFWAGPLLIDTGSRPQAAEEVPVANIVPAGHAKAR